MPKTTTKRIEHPACTCGHARETHNLSRKSFIERANHQKLYRLEETRDEAIRAAAKELGKVLKLGDYWREVLPEALLSILDTYDRRAVKLACQTWLEKNPDA